MKLGDGFRNYGMRSLRQDATAGLIVGIVAIPLGMAFAIASGVKPEYGLFTVIVAGICVSLFGGSRFQIGGPTGAFVPVLFAIVLQYGYENLLVAGFLAGVLLLLMGLLRLGKWIAFIPRPVTVGFTAGIAVTIFAGQIGNFLGLQDLKKHEAFLPNMKELALHLGDASGYGLLTAGISLAFILLAPKLLPGMPGSLAGLLAATAAASLFYPGHVATIGSAYGAVPNSLPAIHWPALSLERIVELIRPALVIALLGGIESLLSAVVADGMAGTRHDSNRELIGQGIANMAAPLFGGIPATGAIARTATNIKSGAVSRLSGVIHGIVVLLVLFLLAPYASAIPLAAMAPILMVVAWNMSERRAFARLLKTGGLEALVPAATFLLTVLTDLTTAVEAGLLLSGLIFILRMGGALTVVRLLPEPQGREGTTAAASPDTHGGRIGAFAVEGALFFATAHRLERMLRDEADAGRDVLILDAERVPYIDATGEACLAAALEPFARRGGTVLIAGLRPQPFRALAKPEWERLVAPGHRFARADEAYAYARSRPLRADSLRGRSGERPAARPDSAAAAGAGAAGEIEG
ncbi:sulfate permease, SulP family [Paenibacillus sp. UNC496MF]|uniref:SulP family inorganic anion transporter n=1 Tax=Paenibacillus sp. UNC496MF TaxID=1502753 RepID=UPI0008ED19E6|nr:SulP family inorganic anion transporter [Paenibacillus sp. UNC496MF]SFJ78961.1 sulfate permease, SulP family [Paenibacillus sp. UNC496MF]